MTRRVGGYGRIIQTAPIDRAASRCRCVHATGRHGECRETPQLCWAGAREFPRPAFPNDAAPPDDFLSGTAERAGGRNQESEPMNVKRGSLLDSESLIMQKGETVAGALEPERTERRRADAEPRGPVKRITV